MAGLMDRLSAVKAKQQEAVEKKADEEKNRAGKEAKRTELSAAREQAAAEISSTEASATEAESALQEVSAMEAQRELDEDTKAELATIKVEAQATKEAFGKLKARLVEIDAEISALDEGREGAMVMEASAEFPPASPADVPTPEISQRTEATMEIASADSEKEKTQVENAVGEKFNEFIQKDVQEWIDGLSEKGDDEALEGINRMLQRVGSPEKYPDDKLLANLELSEAEKGH